MHNHPQRSAQWKAEGISQGGGRGQWDSILGCQTSKRRRNLEVGKETSDVTETGRSSENVLCAAYHIQHEGDYIEHPSSPWEQEKEHCGPPGALHITSTTQTLPCRRAGPYLPIPAACTSQTTPSPLQMFILFPCAPRQHWTPSSLRTRFQPRC